MEHMGRPYNYLDPSKPQTGPQICASGAANFVKRPTRAPSFAMRAARMMTTWLPT